MAIIISASRRARNGAIDMAKKTLKAKDIEALENTSPWGNGIPTLTTCTTFTGMCQGPN
jgi:hypothetical protein